MREKMEICLVILVHLGGSGVVLEKRPLASYNRNGLVSGLGTS